jgi:alpha-N-acetylglucosamine transferase
MHRYSKLQLWDQAEDFDLILYMDVDIIAIGRVESVLNWFAPNGIPKSFMGGALDDHGGFSAGVLAVPTNRTLYREMINAAENRELDWDSNYAEQVRRHAFECVQNAQRF